MLRAPKMRRSSASASGSASVRPSDPSHPQPSGAHLGFVLSAIQVIEYSRAENYEICQFLICRLALRGRSDNSTFSEAIVRIEKPLTTKFKFVVRP